MKGCFFLYIFMLLQEYSNVSGQTCMSLLQTRDATQNLCKQRYNKALWQQVIDCHKPLSEEFMRASGEAQCPIPKYVEDPTDTSYTIQDVFLNICGFEDGNIYQRLSGGACILFGESNPPIMSHSSEVAAVISTWGADVPCNIGKCILGLGLHVRNHKRL